MAGKIFEVPPPDRPIARWHVAPVIDVAAYGWSWLWVLVPLALLPDRKADYLGLYIFVLVATDLHRHFGLPYVYLDREVFSRFRARFVLFPAVMFVAWMASPWLARHARPLSLVGLVGLVAAIVLLVQVLRRDRDDAPASARALALALAPALVLLFVSSWLPIDRGWSWLLAALAGSIGVGLHLRSAGRRWLVSAVIGSATAVLVVLALAGRMPSMRVRVIDVLNLAAVIAGAWNIWHVLMQKYGILRMYSAKSERARKVPGWVDRLLVFGWIPVWLLWVGPANRDMAVKGFERGARVLVPLLDGLQAAQPYLLPPAIALVVVALGAFLIHEHRINGLTNAPRLWMAAGTTVLAVCFFFVHPLKVYLAYAFSHAVEYMVFVWAFQRRRYAAPLDHDPLLGRVLRRPWLAYGGFILVGAVVVVVLKYYGRTIFVDEAQPFFLGIATSEWFMYWGVYQSMVHFYFDGFLWKMRRANTRAHL